MQFTNILKNNDKIKVLMTDTNILIPLLDFDYPDKELREEIVSEVSRLIALEINLIYSQPCYLEILNYFRNKWIFKACQRMVQYQHPGANQIRGIISGAEARRKSGVDDRYLFDNEVKKIRLAFSSNEKVWSGITIATRGKIKALDNELNKLKIVYAKFDSIHYPLTDKTNWPNWSGMHSMIENYLLASNDAAILNMVNYKTIDGIISNDSDLEFAVKQGAIGPKVLFQI